MKRTFWIIQLFKRLPINLKILSSLFKDYKAGRYRKFPIRALSAIALFIAYIINPFDLISDLVPFWGQLDDVAMLTFCLYLIEKETEQYTSWQSNTGNF